MSYDEAEPVSSGDTAGRTEAGLHLLQTRPPLSHPGVTRALPRRRSLAKTESVPR